MCLLHSSFKIYNVGATFTPSMYVNVGARFIAPTVGAAFTPPVCVNVGRVYAARVSASKEEDNIDVSRSESRGVPHLRRNRRNHDRRS